MSYTPQFEPNPTPNNPLVKLTTKIEEVLAQEPAGLVTSALVSAVMRLETAKCDGNVRKAALRLAYTFKQIADQGNN